MASTCSYKINNDVTRNTVCFVALRESGKNDLCQILIEKTKAYKYFDKKFVEEYLNDLMTMGFQFEWVFDKEYIITINEENNIKILLGLFLRYLWEGGNMYDYTKDNFFMTLIYYRNLKLDFPEENLYKLLLMASNYFVDHYIKANTSNKYNDNHYIRNWYNPCSIENTLDHCRKNMKLFGIIQYYNSGNKQTIDYSKLPEHWNERFTTN